MYNHHKKFILYINIGTLITVSAFSFIRMANGIFFIGVMLLAASAIFTLLSFLLVRSQHYTFAKLFTIFTSSIYIYTVQFGVPVNISSEYFYFPIMIMSPLLFSTKDKNSKKLMLLGLLIPILTWIASIALPYPQVENLKGFSPEFQKFVQLLNFISAVALTGYFLGRYQRYFSNYQQEIAQRERLISLGEMANGIAHEINNPLTIILAKTKNHLKLLNENAPVTDKMKSDLEIVISTSMRISKTVTTLVSLSRDAESEIFRTIAVKEMINTITDLTKERLANNDIALILGLSDSIMLECRSSQISQAILSLIHNSIDALVKTENTKKEKWIKIETQLEHNFISIIITDSGNGIHQDISQKIMTPFFSTKDIYANTGLGLSLAHSIAVSHNGQLSHSIDSKNTRFILKLPLK